MGKRKQQQQQQQQQQVEEGSAFGSDLEDMDEDEDLEEEQKVEQLPAAAGSAGALAPAANKFMQGFWDLSSPDTEVRAKAALIVSAPHSAADVEYALKRLLRGLCSRRDSARQGFGAALAELLRQLPEESVSTADTVARLLEGTKMGTGLKGSEERDQMLGRLFGCVAIAQSGRLASQEGQTCLSLVLDAVLELRAKRKWLRQAATESVIALARGSPSAAILDTILPKVGSVFGGSEPPQSPDELHLALGLHSVLVAKDLLKPAEKMLPAYLHHKRAVRITNAGSLADCAKLSAVAFPRAHLMWTHVWFDLGLVSPRSSQELDHKPLKALRRLWEACVDGCLAQGSHNQKGACLLLARQVLPMIPAQAAAVDAILSASVVRILVNHASRKGSALHELCRSFLDEVGSLVGDSEPLQLMIANALMRHGGLRFDSRTGTRVTARILSGLSEACLEEHASFLKRAVLSNQGDMEDALQQRVAAVESLYSLWRTACSRGLNRARWIDEVATFFMEWGLLQVSSDTALPAEVAEACERRLFSILADLSGQPLSWDADGVLLPICSLVMHWEELVGGDNPSHVARAELEEGEQLAWDSMVSMLRDANRESKLSAAFAGLIIHIAFHMRAGASELAMQIGDLIETHERISGTSIGLDGVDGDDEGDEDDDDDPMLVLVDTLIAVLSSPSGYAVKGLRDATKKAWAAVCSAKSMTPEALDCLLSTVCGLEETLVAKKAAHAPEEGGDTDEEDDESDADEDLELNGGKEDDSEGERREEDGYGEEEEEEEEEEEDHVDIADLEQLLGEEDEATEAALVAMLQARKMSRKAGAVESQRALLQLRLRALDLLETFAAKNKNSPLLPSAFMPVYRAVKRLSKRPGPAEGNALRERLEALFRNHLTRCRPSVASNFRSGEATEFFLLECGKNGGALARDGAVSCLRFARKSEAGAGSEREKAELALVAALDGYMSRTRGRYGALDGRLFTEIVDRLPAEEAESESGGEDIVHVMMPSLVRGLREAKTDFLRTDAARLIHRLLARSGGVACLTGADVPADLPLQCLVGLAAALKEAGEGSGGGKAKRLRPLLQCSVSVLSALEGGASKMSEDGFGSLIDELSKEAELVAGSTSTGGVEALGQAVAEAAAKVRAKLQPAATPSKRKKPSTKTMTESKKASKVKRQLPKR
jgi:hypothetical protein